MFPLPQRFSLGERVREKGIKKYLLSPALSSSKKRWRRGGK